MDAIEKFIKALQSRFIMIEALIIIEVAALICSTFQINNDYLANYISDHYSWFTSIVMPIYYSSKNKKKQQHEELNKIKAYGESINQFTRNKGKQKEAKKTKENNNQQSASLGFEAKLFLAADKLRGSMDASEYKHIALDLFF